MSWLLPSDLVLRIHRQTGRIESLTAMSQVIDLPANDRLPLVEIGLLAGEEKIVVTPRVSDVAWSEEPNYRLRVSFARCVAMDDSASWPLSGWYAMNMESDGTMKWQLYIENGSDLAACEMLFPRLGPLYLQEQMILMYPHHAGEKIIDPPIALASAKYRNFWRAASVPTEFGFSREINYCGLASMTWMDLSAGEIGIYTASYDPAFPVTGLRVETGGPQDRWISLSFRKYVDIHPGQTYLSPPIVWAFHSGDWHQAAEKYREWFNQHVRQEQHPADLNAEVVLTPHYNFRRDTGICYKFEDIPAMARRDKEEFGSNHFFIAGWNHMGFDSHYPNYNPDLELGTPLKLWQGVEYVKENGGFVTFYINCRIMDKYSEYLPTLGERWMLRTKEQEPIYEVYGPAETVVLCPSHPEWRSYLEEFAVWMCKAYGARGIYYDQLGSATPYPCYGAHEHGPVKGTSGFNQGYIDLIERTTERLKKFRPDGFLMIENCGDIYSSRVWGSLAWNGELYDEFFNLYKYTFPEHTLINMVNPRKIDDPVEQEQMFNKDLARAFVLGSIFWFEGDAFQNRVQDQTRRRRMLDLLQGCLAVRRAVTTELADAVFQDDIGLMLPGGVTGSRWRRKSGAGGIVLIANQALVSGKATVLSSGAERVTLRLYNSAQRSWLPWPAEVDGERLSFALPETVFVAVQWSGREKG